MAEKPEELNIRDIKLSEYTAVGKGILELDDEDLSFFEKVTWKLYVYTIGNKILSKQKNKIFGETMIQFFPRDKQALIESAKKNNKTFLMKSLVKPLFFITYDSKQCSELIDRSGEKVPKKLFFLVLCR